MGFTEVEYFRLIRTGRVRSVPKGSTICEESKGQTSMYFLLEGSIEVTKETGGGGGVGTSPKRRRSLRVGEFWSESRFAPVSTMSSPDFRKRLTNFPLVASLLSPRPSLRFSPLLACIPPNSFIGEMSFLTYLQESGKSTPASTTCVAETDCEVVEWDFGKLAEELELEKNRGVRNALQVRAERRGAKRRLPHLEPPLDSLRSSL